MQGNVKTTIVMCQCGSLHALLHSSADLCQADILVPSNACEPRIMVQFDGSAHRTCGVGGAGAALLQVECSGLALLDWAQALPVCADNIVAETHEADLALSLYEKYRQLSQQQSITPLPLDRIQGDIKPLLQHLDFRGRFRRKDLINLIHQFHTKRSRIAPNSITEYRPREANTLAIILRGKLVHGSFKKVAYETLLSSQLQSRLTHPMICCLKPMRSYWAHIKKARLFSSCVKNLGAVSLNLEDLRAGMRGNVLPK